MGAWCAQIQVRLGPVPPFVLWNRAYPRSMNGILSELEWYGHHISIGAAVNTV
jgi:hypothetical protein